MMISDKIEQKQIARTYIANWQAPSNIAIVKYWGKMGFQQPINPNISFSLSSSYTQTTVTATERKQFNDSLEVEFYFEGECNDAFATRITKYLDTVVADLPYLKEFALKIESSNSFPHSSGIASSASSMAALALALLEIQNQIDPTLKLDYKMASHLARLGSGSGCRSVKGRWNLWGKNENIASSSNLYAIEIEDIHPIFNTLNDTILIIDPNKKSTSSTRGHSLMKNHPFKEARIQQANEHTIELLECLKSGNFDTFIQITENEALTLHGLMMNSNPSYTLMLPKTLEAISKIREFRATTNFPICFTLDAGPNIHLIYPEEIFKKVKSFIQNDLAPLCANQRVIYDHIGAGATSQPTSNE
jgi:diphosphomevalonate decarboxylase